MLLGFTLFCVVAIAWVTGFQFAGAQSQSAPSQAASAKPAIQSSGRPSSFQIKENILTQKSAILQGQLREVKRCITDASLPQTLRDPQGNINRVPQTDLVDCTRKLNQLQRQFQALARQGSQLAEEAKFQGEQLKIKLDVKKISARLKGKSGQ